MNVQKIYFRRFTPRIEFRKKMWKVLCEDYFQKFIKYDSTVADIGAGYCEFINNIKAKRKIAVDLNPSVKEYADTDVTVVLSNSTSINSLKDSSVDYIFISNFFEHLTKSDITRTIKEAYRILKRDGEILILQPNIRYCYNEYWMFFDHITPLDHDSLTEVLDINNFRIVKCIPRFLPFTAVKKKYPKSVLLIKLYLKFHLLYKIFGSQMFILAKKVDYSDQSQQRKYPKVKP